MAEVRNFTLSAKWAEDALTVIPTPPVVNLSYRNTGLEAGAIKQGQVYGGLGNSADWNQLLWLMSSMLYEAERQGVLSWSPLLNYGVGALVMGANDKLYLSLKASGPDTTVVNPATEPESEDPTWLDVTSKLTAPAATQYELCEFYDFRHPTARSGMVPRYGSLIQNAATLYPKAWAYLQTADGQLLCKTEAQWNSLHNASPWNGIGGVPFYVQDLGAGTLRVPDTRGMYKEDAGFDSLGVGGVHGDMIRNITGKIETTQNYEVLFADTYNVTGALGLKYKSLLGGNPGTTYTNQTSGFDIDVSRVVPTGNANKPRGFGVLPCVYLGA